MARFSKLNYLNVGPGGTFQRSGRWQSRPADVDAIFDHIRSEGVRKLVVYFHGGLVDEWAGMSIARNIAHSYEGIAHPVTFVWETGLLETISRNLGTIHRSALYMKLLSWVIRHASEQLSLAGGRGVADRLDDVSIQRELAKEVPFDLASTQLPSLHSGREPSHTWTASKIDDRTLETVAADVRDTLELEMDHDSELPRIIARELATVDLIDRRLRERLQRNARSASFLGLAEAVAAIVVRVIRRYVDRRDHGFFPTVVEEILRGVYVSDVGAWMWNGMKDAAERMWWPNTAPVSEESHAGRYFLDRLRRAMREDPPLEVHLTGHSAGAIAICHMLRTLGSDYRPNIPVRNVLLLAPAVRCDLFYREVVRQPERFERFRMFTLRDDLEQKDRLAAFVYPRSLLYFISGVLEEKADTPLAGLDIHTRGNAPHDTELLRSVSEFLRSDARLVLAEALEGPAGTLSAAHHHTDFDTDAETLKSLAYLIAAPGGVVAGPPG